MYQIFLTRKDIMFDDDFNDYDDFDAFDRYILHKLEAFMQCAKSYYANKNDSHKKIEDSLKLNILIHTYSDDDLLEIFHLLNSSKMPRLDKTLAHQIGFEAYSKTNNIPEVYLFCYSTLFDEITTRLVEYINDFSECISVDEDGSIYLAQEDQVAKTNIQYIINNLDKDSLVYLDYLSDEIIQNMEEEDSPIETIKSFELTQNYINQKIDSLNKRTTYTIEERSF